MIDSYLRAWPARRLGDHCVDMATDGCRVVHCVARLILWLLRPALLRSASTVCVALPPSVTFAWVGVVAKARQGLDVRGMPRGADARRFDDHRYACRGRVREQIGERSQTDLTGADVLVPIPHRASGVL